MDEMFHDLGTEPTRMNDVGISSKINYPTLYIDDCEELLKGFKIGKTNKAEIIFEPTLSGLKVLKIKFLKDDEQDDSTIEYPKKPKSRQEGGADSMYSMSNG